MPRFDGALLRARRKKLGLTIQELSGLCGLKYVTLATLERGGARPSVTSLEKLCKALSCDPNTLFIVDDDDDADIRPTDLGAAADQWVADTVASAPPLTERQAARISAALFGRAS